MKKATTLTLFLLLSASLVQAQQSEFLLSIPNSDDLTQGYATGLQSGARSVAGPYDLDGDGLYEVLVTDYTGGGRVHVVENVSVDTWELVYSTPWNDSTASSQNGRQAIGTDLDGDGFGEIVMLMGGAYSATNPNIADLPFGLYVYEFTGTDNDYGTAPATVYEFDADLPDRWRSDQMTSGDIDDDGIEELMFPNNAGGGFNTYDNWYILSVTGDIGTGFDTWIQEARVSTRSETFDPVDRGGGSPAAIHAADLDGNGTVDLSMTSWNWFNFTNGTVSGADTYTLPDENASNVFLQATRSTNEDHVALFGGVVVDIDGNGDDEIFYPRWPANAVSLLNYESGEDVLQVTTDNLILDIIPGLTDLGLTTGDIDGDGAMELIGTGASPNWLSIAEYRGGDVESPSSYSLETFAYEEMADTDGSTFNTINRDSAGVMTQYTEPSGGSPDFGSKIQYLGDADLDGLVEIVFGVQSVEDSTFVYDEVFNPADSTYSRTVASAASRDRVFMRVVSAGPNFAVSIDEERIIVPDDYRLHDNYPNPFNPTTTISFTLPLDKAVSVRVFDMTGRLVRTLVNNEYRTEGYHEVVWDATSDAGNYVASGSYLYTLEYGNFRQSKTMVLIK